jgi:hypothetical protein
VRARQASNRVEPSERIKFELSSKEEIDSDHALVNRPTCRWKHCKRRKTSELELLDIEVSRGVRLSMVEAERERERERLFTTRLILNYHYLTTNELNSETNDFFAL